MNTGGSDPIRLLFTSSIFYNVVASNNAPSQPHLPQISHRHKRSEKIDHISTCLRLLITILSLLPLKDAARCSVLSRRWRSLWPATPLIHLDDASLNLEEPKSSRKRKSARGSSSSSSSRDEESWCRQAFFDIIAAHQAPVKSCRVSRFDHPIFYPTVDLMIRNLMNKGLQFLALSFSSVYSNSKFGYKLPNFLLSYANLKQLDLYFCQIPDLSYSSVFPNLVVVSMRFVNLNDKFMACLLSSCLNLEFMKLHHCTGLQTIKISSPKLRIFILNDNFRAFSCTKELIIQEAPNLEHLMLGENTTKATNVTVSNAPKLQKLGFICLSLTEFRIGEAWFRIDDLSNLLGSTIMGRVKSIAIKMNFNDEKHKSIFLSLLEFFPCLESLSIMHRG
ncbi:hypothetical protein LUZ60_007841 [Juncus effusus]|nr:hypothetical protein LUZ60_007841 [Juncus effusus]